MRTIAARTTSVSRGTFSQRFIRWRNHHREALLAWLILVPILAYFAVFQLFPIVADVAISFTDWKGVTGTPQWVGLANYRRYLLPPYPLIVRNTLVFSIAILSIQTTAALFIALLLNQKVAGRGVFRALWYIPTLTSGAIMAQVAMVLIAPDRGILNELLKALGRDIVIWSLEPNWIRLIVILFSAWRGVGVPTVLLLAALQGIHPEISEAARVDGAGGWALLRRITLPLLKPMIIFVLVTSMISSFQIFEPIRVMTRGAPRNMTNVMMYQIYHEAFMSPRMGMAGAGSVIMALLLLGFSLTNIRLMSREGQGE